MNFQEIFKEDTRTKMDLKVNPDSVEIKNFNTFFKIIKCRS